MLTCVLSVGVCSWRVGCGVGRLPMRADQTHGLRAGGARENVDPLAGNKQISIRFSVSLEEVGCLLSLSTWLIVGKLGQGMS